MGNDDLGQRLGRIDFTVSEQPTLLHSSAAAGWHGAFMTHVRTRPGFSFRGSWSWIRLSMRLSRSGTPFPRKAGTAADPSYGRLQLGLPHAGYLGSWAVATHSASLFIDPALFESLAHAPCPPDAMAQSARHLHDDAVLEHLLHVLLADIKAGSPEGPTLGESVVGLILPRLVAARPDSPRLYGARLSAPELRRLRSYVRDHLAAPIHLADLSGLLGISPRHLSRVVKATLGVTPHRYVMDCRIELATQLLMESRLACEDIASLCGFADQRHMSTTFRRVLNATPLQIRHTAP